MILHNDRKSFEEIIIQTAKYYNIDVSIIEKVGYKTIKASLVDIIDIIK